MNDPVRLACRTEIVLVSLAKILPLRLPEEGIRKTSKYQCIAASIRELGLVEPLVVYPQASADGMYMLLDGHIRWMILKEIGAESAKCLISTDDESFTYNHKVNRMSAIQEHFMIMKAIKSGVSEARIARSLNVEVQSINQKRDLLEGVCPEAIELLRDKKVTGASLRELRRVKPMRQIEIAELLVAASNYTVGYVKCLVATTPADSLIDGERDREERRLSPEEISRMEHEMESLGKEFKLIDENHGKNTLNLVLVVAYLKKMTENTRVARYLANQYPEISAEFQKLVESRTLSDRI
jgi:hypothetical protein